MHISIFSVFIRILIFLALSVIVGLVAYKAIYNARIKRRLFQGDTTGKQWPQPRNVVLTVLIVALSIVCVASVLSGFAERRQTYVNINHIGDVQSYRPHELPDSQYDHLLEAYETGSLSGYTLTEGTEGDFHYLYFRSEHYFDLLHPSFVLFVEYVGEQDYGWVNETTGISFGTESGFSGSSCCETAPYFCVVGNVNHAEGHSATYQLSLYAAQADVKKDFDGDTTANAGAAITFVTTGDGVRITLAQPAQ